MIDRTDNEIADLVEAVYKNPDKNFGHFKGGLKEAIRRLRGNTDRQLRDALTVALQGLGQLAKSGENRSRSRPSNAQLVKRCEQALERVARVLEGHPTYIGENGHVCLHTLPKDQIERNESTERGREIWAAVDAGAEKAPQIVKDRLAENNDE